MEGTSDCSQIHGNTLDHIEVYIDILLEKNRSPNICSEWFDFDFYFLSMSYYLVFNQILDSLIP